MEQFENDGVIVTLEWQQSIYFYSYYISITPDIVMIEDKWKYVLKIESTIQHFLQCEHSSHTSLWTNQCD